MHTNKKSSALRYTIALLGLAAALSAATSQAEETPWQKAHPRRAEVNQRLDNQNKRINKEVAEGEMSKGKAARLKKQDHQIRQEERDMASQDHGHISKQEQKTLNQQENAVSKKIGS
ncbi:MULTISPECIES: hypothetical protein [unclassified Undibacterium]|uniref:hypothetical protein n=1 Tax=unclassified Undibacterium TaxID=2630295 RepID=UPI002AC9DE12|nr:MULTISPECIES: hypothetical protein [unclassified Undibacterium]MEB0140768.1 hypothetical protein [Undibacterium sp. CCC2.1]MEB0173945.1 hypothetical protein [Undibacterium sp. CCC1.1]MEB0177733.1 hypothetical protein [Undibacterium sp. CCC3.4]MEB0217137.1 hypothetical protein [Undibacterium sp. 5I2]WPX45562.1 hypothetical protein RHM61_10255 [Undibacterium sp. CCC3.4]